MASLYRAIDIARSAADVWADVRDVSAPHRRLVPGVLKDTQMDGDERIVTFANGLVVRERIVTIDEARRRFVYAARSDRLSHHQGAMQVIAVGESRARFEWTLDLLPDAMSESIAALMDAGIQAMKRRWSSA